MSIVKTGILSKGILLATAFAAKAACGYDDSRPNSHSQFSSVVGTGFHHISECANRALQGGSGYNAGDFIRNKQTNEILLFVCQGRATRVRAPGMQNTRC